MADVLALKGESPDAIREGVHVALADCADIFKAQAFEIVHFHYGTKPSLS